MIATRRPLQRTEPVSILPQCDAGGRADRAGRRRSRCKRAGRLSQHADRPRACQRAWPWAWPL